MTEWEPEVEEQPEQSPASEYKIKARLVLENSDQYEWGVVKDCHGNVNHIPDDAEVVGTWNKYSEGIFWVTLTTSVEALVDKATQLFLELSEKRKQDLALHTTLPKSKSKTTRTRTPKPVEPEPEVDPLYAKLRARLGR